MKAFLPIAKFLLIDLASSLLFVVLFFLTHNALLSIALAVILGIVQIARQLVRRRPVHVMEWVSLLLIIGSGTATLLAHDWRFMLFKPSAIYAIVGMVMLRRGWINRYLPDIVRQTASDGALWLGFAWAGLMFVSAAMNAYLALTVDVASWALAMTIFGIVSKTTLSVGGFLALRWMVHRRLLSMPADERQDLLVATGWQTEPSAAAGLA